MFYLFIYLLFKCIFTFVSFCLFTIFLVYQIKNQITILLIQSMLKSLRTKHCTTCSYGIIISMCKLMIKHTTYCVSITMPCSYEYSDQVRDIYNIMPNYLYAMQSTCLYIYSPIIIQAGYRM